MQSDEYCIMHHLVLPVFAPHHHQQYSTDICRSGSINNWRVYNGWQRLCDNWCVQCTVNAFRQQIPQQCLGKVDDVLVRVLIMRGNSKVD